MKSNTLKAIGMAVGSTGLGVGGGIEVTGKVITAAGLKVCEIGQSTQQHSRDFKDRYLERAEAARLIEANRAEVRESIRHAEALESLKNRSVEIEENYKKLLEDLSDETAASQKSIDEAIRLEEELHTKKVAASTPPIPTTEEVEQSPGTVPATA